MIISTSKYEQNSVLFSERRVLRIRDRGSLMEGGRKKSSSDLPKIWGTIFSPHSEFFGEPLGRAFPKKEEKKLGSIFIGGPLGVQGSVFLTTQKRKISPLGLPHLLWGYRSSDLHPLGSMVDPAG